MKKEMLIGFLVSIIATSFGFYLYTQYISELEFVETLQKIKENGTLGTVIAIAAIPNLFVFLIYIKKKQDYRARGVLIATIFTTFLTFILKFI